MALEGSPPDTAEGALHRKGGDFVSISAMGQRNGSAPIKFQRSKKAQKRAKNMVGQHGFEP